MAITSYRRLYLAIIVEMALMMVVVALWGKPAIDTISYFSAYDTLLQGRLDIVRTPVYPLFIGVCRSLFGDTGGRIVVCLTQCAIFLFSVTRFRVIASRLIPNPRIAFLATAVYGLLPGPMSLNFYLLTESLALSGITILLYLLSESLHGNIRATWWSVPLSFGLIMLRPALIYLPAALLLFWIPAMLLKKASVRICIVGLTAVIICGAGCYLYSWQMKRQNGYFGLSLISLVNTYVGFKDTDFVNFDYLTPPLPDPEAAYDHYKSVLLQHKHDALEYLVRKRLPAVCASDAVYGSGSAVVPPIRLLTKYISVNNGAVYLLFLLFVGLQLYSDIRQRRYSLYRWYLVAMFSGCNAIAAIGAPNEWPRLLIPDIPVLLLIVGISFNTACKMFSPSCKTKQIPQESV